MELDVMTLITDGGSLGLLTLVIWMINKHFTRMLDNHDEDRRTWLEAIKEITAKLGLIERDLSDIEDDVSDIKTVLQEKL
jgi:hypothetical protein